MNTEKRRDINKRFINKMVMIRTYDAGVHFGTLVDSEPTDGNSYDVYLENNRRIYSWTGAFTLTELATQGSKRTDSRISMVGAGISLKAIEIIAMTDVAVKNLESIPPYNP